MKKNYSLVILTVVLVLGFLYLKLFNRRSPWDLSLLVRVEPDELTALQMVRGDLKVGLVREHGVWRSESQVQVRLEQERIIMLLNILTQRKAKRILSVPRDEYGEFGLSDSNSYLIYVHSPVVQDTLRMGNLTPDSNYVYIRKNSESGIFIIPRSLRESVDYLMKKLDSKSGIDA
jgi:hypothetical protein